MKEKHLALPKKKTSLKEDLDWKLIIAENPEENFCLYYNQKENQQQ